jgi:hypothetical protein
LESEIVLDVVASKGPFPKGSSLKTEIVVDGVTPERSWLKSPAIKSKTVLDRIAPVGAASERSDVESVLVAKADSVLGLSGSESGQQSDEGGEGDVLQHGGIPCVCFCETGLSFV